MCKFKVGQIWLDARQLGSRACAQCVVKGVLCTGSESAPSLVKLLLCYLLEGVSRCSSLLFVVVGECCGGAFW